MKDSRLHEFEFQTGYCLSDYWRVVVLFFFARARREAQLFSVPLLWIQAADDIKGLDAQPKEEQDKVLKALLRAWNVHDTAHLHTLWPAYPGQRVRLLEKISPGHRVVQESEGTVIIVVPDPAEVQDLTNRRSGASVLPSGRLGMFRRLQSRASCRQAREQNRSLSA